MLIELVAGLAIVGILFLGMRVLLDQLGDSRDRFVREAHRADDAANATRLLRDLVHNAEAGTDSANRFTGGDHDASFISWCRAPGGWLERCHVALRLIPVGDSTVMTASLPGIGAFVLWRGGGDARFLYYTPSVPDDTWVSVWGRSIALPSAIGVATDKYLVVLGAGGRG